MKKLIKRLKHKINIIKIKRDATTSYIFYAFSCKETRKANFIGNSINYSYIKKKKKVNSANVFVPSIKDIP
jgi:hypothetical protein